MAKARLVGAEEGTREWRSFDVGSYLKDKDGRLYIRAYEVLVLLENGKTWLGTGCMNDGDIQTFTLIKAPASIEITPGE